jgi:hypothetical protein
MRMLCTMAAALGAAGLLSTPALGAATPPAPCSPDVAVTDPAGDSFFEPTGLGTLNNNFNKLGHEAAPEADTTGLFFTWGKVNNKFALWANIQLAKADLTQPPVTDAAGGNSLYVVYASDGVLHYLRAENQDGSRLVFSYGDVDAANFQYKGATGSTTGTLFAGDNGFVQIQVPAAVGGKIGATLTAPAVASDYRQTPQGAPGLVNQVDALPDGFDGFSPNGTDVIAGTCGLPPDPDA